MIIILFLSLALLSFNVNAIQFWDQYQAVNLYKAKKYDEAAAKFENLLLRGSGDFNKLVNMARVLYRQGRFAEATSYFKKVLSRKKNLNDSQIENLEFDLGSAYAQQEKWLDALKAFEAVVAINLKNIRAKKNIEIIKKILEESQKQDQKKDNSGDNQSEKEQNQSKDSDQKDSGDGKEQSQAGNSSGNKENFEKQKDKQEGEEDGTDRQDQSAQQNSDEEGGNKSDKNDQHKQSDASKQGLSDKQHDKQNSSSVSEKEDKALLAKKQAQEARQAEIEQKLSWQEKKYLEAVEQSDNKANAHMMKMRAKRLKGQGGSDEHSW